MKTKDRARLRRLQDRFLKSNAAQLAIKVNGWDDKPFGAESYKQLKEFVCPNAEAQIRAFMEEEKT